MGWGLRSGALGLGISLALLGVSSSAAAAKPIKGKLSQPGYTVIALAEDGSATSAQANPGFKLTPPAKGVTLHLRGPDGEYAGPIVVGRKGKKAIVGVKAGAKLRKVKVRDGYAKVAKKLPKKSLDKQAKALAENKVPIGAGNFGHVASKASDSGPDQDLDGVPAPLDIDDDGDLILDYQDSPTAKHALQAPPPPEFGVLSTLSLGLGQTTNANHPALAEGIDEALKSSGGLIFGSAFGSPPCPPGGFVPCAASTELDCAGDPTADPPRPGLAYCSREGTGTSFGADFPECCDPDNDGFGTLPPFLGAPQLLHGATSAEIKTGGVLIERGSDASGSEIDAFPNTLQYVFATVPALISYDDDGPGGQDPATLTYPYPPGVANDLPVTPRPSGDADAGDVVVTLTFWRPQRSRIANDPALGPGDSAAWTDIGGNGYTVEGPCPQDAFSENDDNLADPPAGPLGGGTIAGGGGFKDLAPDRPANAQNTLTFTVNLTTCLESKGLGSSFDESGEIRQFALLASGRGGRADQGLSFKRE